MDFSFFVREFALKHVLFKPLYDIEGDQEILNLTIHRLSGKNTILAHDCHFCFVIKLKMIKRADTSCKYQPYI